MVSDVVIHTDLTDIIPYIQSMCHTSHHMLHEKYNQKTKFLVLVCLSVAIVVGLSPGTYFSSARAQNMTSMEPTAIKSAITNLQKLILFYTV